MKWLPRWRTRRMISAGLFLLVVIVLAARVLMPQTGLSGQMPIGVVVSHHQGDFADIACVWRLNRR